MFSEQFVSSQLNLFLSRLDELPEELKLHFLTRLFRLTGRPQYLNQIRTIIFSDFVNDVAFLVNTLKGNQNENSEVFLRSSILRQPQEYKRIVRRMDFYKKETHLQALLKSLIIMRKWKEWHLSQGEKSEIIKELVSQFGKINWRADFLSINHLQANPVHFINGVFAIHLLEFGNYQNLLLDWMYELYPTNSVLTDEKLYDQVYAYTHIIINRSNFYQNFLTVNQIRNEAELLTFFERNFAKIYKNLNLDLILEMLLCFQLGQQSLPSWKTQAYQWLNQHFKHNQQLFKSDAKATFSDMEHFYSLFFLHFMMGKKFFLATKPLF